MVPPKSVLYFSIPVDKSIQSTNLFLEYSLIASFNNMYPGLYREKSAFMESLGSIIDFEFESKYPL